MITLKIILIVIALVSTAILALSIRIVLVKDGKFPETHLNRNQEIKKKGIILSKQWIGLNQPRLNSKKNTKILQS